MRNKKGQWIKGCKKHQNWYPLNGINHPTKVIIEKELLYSLYWGNCYSKNELSKIFKCSRQTIYKYMKKYDIPTRVKYSKTERKGCKNELNIWRYKVYERYNYTCQECGKIGHYLNAHHIKSFKDYPDLRFDIDNGITLCRKCHMNLHNGGL